MEKNSDALKCGRRVELARSFSKLGAGTYHTNNSFLESCVYFFRRGPAETIKSKRGKEKDQGATPGAQNVLLQFRDKLHSQGSIVLLFGFESVSYERSRLDFQWVLREISARVFFL